MSRPSDQFLRNSVDGCTEIDLLESQRRCIAGQNRCALQNVFEFADISWPGMGRQLGHHLSSDPLHWHRSTQQFEKVLDEAGQVFEVLAERGSANQENGETVVEIRAKGSRLGLLCQRTMGRRYNAHIHFHSLVIAHALQFPALNEPQKFGLQGKRHLSDLIEKERASIGSFDPADTSLYRTGESTAGVAEEFRLEQILGNCSTVDRYKRLATSLR